MNPTELWNLFWLFTRVSLLSWGGGPASLALMQTETVRAGYLTPAQFVDAVALGNALPGPIAPQVAAYVGYQQAGFWGAIAAVAGVVGPTTVLMLALVVVFFQLKELPAVRAMITAVRPVVVALLAWTAYELANAVLRGQGTSWPLALRTNWDKFALAALALVALTRFNINPAVLIFAAAVVGLILYR